LFFLNICCRLLTFLPGKILHKVPYEPDLLFEYGRFVAQIDQALTSFAKKDLFEGNDSIWFMSSVPRLHAFLDMGYLDKWKVDLVRGIVNQFEEEFRSECNNPRLKKGEYCIYYYCIKTNKSINSII
jgi:hypothetical protein